MRMFSVVDGRRWMMVSIQTIMRDGCIVVIVIKVEIAFEFG